MDTRTLAALGPLVALVVGLVTWALTDLARHPRTRVLPAWAWALLCVLSFPLGVLAYLLLGRSSEDRA